MGQKATNQKTSVGVAGWSVPPQYAHLFPSSGSHLERYAARHNAVEINSSFHRSHLPKTYARWAAITPDGFRFSVKMPKEITHTRKLVDAIEPLESFLREVTQLGTKLGPVLVQLPPKLALDEVHAPRFLRELRDRFNGSIALEPRHPTWFGPPGETLLRDLRIARVAADPALVPGGDEPGGADVLRYYRLHGSPDTYYSSYSDDYLHQLMRKLRTHTDAGEEVWCIFDNTARQNATPNALRLLSLLSG